MGFLDRLIKRASFDWCKPCAEEMITRQKQLFLVPVFVGYQRPPDDADYFTKNLVPIDTKKDIPTGQYACGGKMLVCPSCGKTIVSLEYFLAVHDNEMVECYYHFKNGELDSLFSAYTMV